MSLQLPGKLTETDDVAVTSLHSGLTVHRLGDPVTPCGVPQYALVHPYPAAGHVLHLAPHWCERCWPQQSPWAQMLALAYPSRFRTADINTPDGRHINQTYARSGAQINERSRP